MEMFLLQQKFGGKVIDIVSGDIRTQEEKDEALGAIKNTILEICLIVVIGYDYCLSFFSNESCHVNSSYEPKTSRLP